MIEDDQMLLPDKRRPQLPNSSFDLLADRKWNECLGNTKSVGLAQLGP
jgi:hypothetical protein